jgi:hypothetical protein
MMEATEYTPRERVVLRTLAGAGFIGLNGAFVLGVLRPGTLAAALRNPIALAFIVEALVLVAVLAYLLRRWRASRLPWGWFVVLSLAGGIAFSLPMALLWPRKSRRGPPPSP